MVAAERQSGQDNLRCISEGLIPGRNLVADDGRPFFSVQISLVDSDACSARAAARAFRCGSVRAEPCNYIRATIVVGVTQRDEEASGVRRGVVVTAAPGVDVHVAVRIRIPGVDRAAEGEGSGDGRV